MQRKRAAFRGMKVPLLLRGKKKKHVNSLLSGPNLSYKRLHIFSFVLSRLRECLVSFLQFVVAYFFCQKVSEAYWDHLKVYAAH